MITKLLRYGPFSMNSANPTLATFHLLHCIGVHIHPYEGKWPEVFFTCLGKFAIILMEAPKFTGKNPETYKIAPHDDVHIYFKFGNFHILKNCCFMGHFFWDALYQPGVADSLTSNCGNFLLPPMGTLR